MSENTPENRTAFIDGEEKEIAPEYEETYDPLDMDNLVPRNFKRKVVDITYKARKNEKTVRAHYATPPLTSQKQIGDDCVTFFNNGDEYAYNPVEKILASVPNQTPREVASGSDILSIKEVNFPGEAPVVGAIEDDTEATVYYETPRSDDIQKVELDVRRASGKAYEVTGDDKHGDRLIRARRADERRIMAHTKRKVTLGRVVRVEFPKGQEFRVEARNLSGDDVEKAREKIQSRVNKAFKYDDVEIVVEHVGGLD